jgi:hypothetical protein
LTWKFRSFPQLGQVNVTYNSFKNSILCNGRAPTQCKYGRNLVDCGWHALRLLSNPHRAPRTALDWMGQPRRQREAGRFGNPRRADPSRG